MARWKSECLKYYHYFMLLLHTPPPPSFQRLRCNTVNTYHPPALVTPQRIPPTLVIRQLQRRTIDTHKIPGMGEIDSSSRACNSTENSTPTSGHRGRRNRFTQKTPDVNLGE
eukprot:scaffold3951_cov111-Skeletonema_dohrnii-CCMP3373.AAC.3